MPDLSSEAPHGGDEQPVAGDESLAEASLIEPRSGPEAEERAYEEALVGEQAEHSAEVAPPGSAGEPFTHAATEGEGNPSIDRTEATADVTDSSAATGDWDEPPTREANTDVFSPFADEAPAESPRRSRLLTVLILLLIIAAAAALFWFFAPPSLKAKLGITSAGATPLQLVTTHMDRTPLESGNELLTVTGRVINPSAKEQDVPPIQAQLKNHSGKVVYSWTIQPPAHSLAAGASASFNSAEVNVPAGADELTITLGEPQA